MGVKARLHDVSHPIEPPRAKRVPTTRTFHDDTFVDESLRVRWLPDVALRERTATKPKSARFDWGDGDTRVVVYGRGATRRACEARVRPPPAPINRHGFGAHHAPR